MSIEIISRIVNRTLENTNTHLPDIIYSATLASLLGFQYAVAPYLDRALTQAIKGTSHEDTARVFEPLNYDANAWVTALQEGPNPELKIVMVKVLDQPGLK